LSAVGLMALWTKEAVCDFLVQHATVEGVATAQVIRPSRFSVFMRISRQLAVLLPGLLMTYNIPR